ncbi:MAG: hypothetical protein J0I20_07340 [Chloroflexi bacterium]|nr:hypothetical protein [Chloroflexota bacterium]OJV95239.1 MAG: hypothetical protein BGO39_24850 [Chloroflexi bacterium 54-19]
MAQKEGLSLDSLYSRYVPEGTEALYEAAGGVSLENELRLARLTVAHLLEEGNHEAVGKALLVVAKLVAEQRRNSGEQAGGIIAGLTQILNEFGLGEGEAGR